MYNNLPIVTISRDRNNHPTGQSMGGSVPECRDQGAALTSTLALLQQPLTVSCSNQQGAAVLESRVATHLDPQPSDSDGYCTAMHAANESPTVPTGPPPAPPAPPGPAAPPTPGAAAG